MRTDSKTYSKEFIKKSKDFIKEKYGQEYISPNIDLLSSKASTKQPEDKKDKPYKKGKK